MSGAESYLNLLREIYGEDIVSECIKKKGEKLSINNQSKRFEKDRPIQNNCRCALPGWTRDLNLNEEHVRDFFIISQNPEPDRSLVTSYRVGLYDPDDQKTYNFDPNHRFNLIKEHMKKIFEVLDFKIEKAYFTDRVKCNMGCKDGYNNCLFFKNVRNAYAMKYRI